MLTGPPCSGRRGRRFESSPTNHPTSRMTTPPAQCYPPPMAAEPDDTFPDPTIAELIAARPHLRLHAMDGLVMEDVPLLRVAGAVGTPTWVYSAGALRARYL